jgi:tetraacyldisaccharide-1-P 4'-kinase
VHPARQQAAAAAKQHSGAKCFLLDDGFQTAVQRDLDLVLINPARDLATGSEAQGLREGPGALNRATIVATLSCETLGPGGAPLVPENWLRLVREPAGLRHLGSGEVLEGEQAPSVRIAAGVGDPDSVDELARQSGLSLTESIRVRDHHAPGARFWRQARRRSPGWVVVTEKDAIGWAAARPPSPQTLVLAQEIAGLNRLWSRVRQHLPL